MIERVVGKGTRVQRLSMYAAHGDIRPPRRVSLTSNSGGRVSSRAVGTSPQPVNRQPLHTMVRVALLLFSLLSPLLAAVVAAGETAHPGPRVRIAQLIEGSPLRQSYPDALPSLAQAVAKRTTLNLDTQPVVLESFEDPRLFEHPFVYANFADREQWVFTEREKRTLKAYLERGGFLFVDAGITAEFLRDHPQLGQHHSFGEWRANPDLQAAFEELFPGKAFKPLGQSHPLYRVFHEGLPDPSALADTVRDFVVQEKWPNGTYSAVGLEVNGRLAVLATPIIAMGWGREPWGEWTTRIGFRIRESAAGLSEELRNASYSGERFETQRRDGRTDIIYCQPATRPAWVREPDDRWRVFRYYHSADISDYTHVFYTRLGINILVYALTH